MIAHIQNLLICHSLCCQSQELGLRPFCSPKYLTDNHSSSTQQCLPFEGHATRLKPTTPSLSAAALTSDPLIMNALLPAPASLLLQARRNFSVHEDNVPCTLASWFLDLINTSNPYLHIPAIIHSLDLE